MSENKEPTVTVELTAEQLMLVGLGLSTYNYLAEAGLIKAIGRIEAAGITNGAAMMTPQKDAIEKIAHIDEILQDARSKMQERGEYL